MSLTKNCLACSVHDIVGFSKSQSDKIVDSILEIIKKTLESDEDILISGFGKFLIKDNTKRRCSSVLNGNAYIPDAKKVVTFRSSPALIRKINQMRD